MISKRWISLIYCVPLVLLAVSHAQAQPRPQIFGCGMSWGFWQGLPTAQAEEFDRRSMDKIVQMGGTNIGIGIAWADIEPVRDQPYDWSFPDHALAEAEARGLEVFTYMGLTPDWALPPEAPTNQPGIGYRYPPATQYIPDFEDYCRAVADRYKGRIKYYQFWNEPNGCSWINDGCSNGHMAHTYTPWLIRWYDAMKSQDADCVLATGGLDYGWYVPNGYQYIEDIYTNGGGDKFDAVAIHPYGQVYNDPIHWQAIFDTYQVLVNHGHGHKKLWLNEYGWNTSDENQKGINIQTVLNELKKPQYHMVFQANYLVITDLPGTPDHGHDYGLCSRNLQTLEIFPRESWYDFQAVDKTFPNEPTFTPTPSPTSGPSRTPTATLSPTITPTPDPSGNILRNPYFEDGFVLAPAQHQTDPQNPRWWALHWSFTGGGWWADTGSGQYYFAHSPSHSQAVGTNWNMLDNSVYQTVQVNPGLQFRFRAWTRGDTDATGNDHLRRRIGVDPTGGTDPNGPNVIHSPWSYNEEVWEEMTLDVTSQDFLLTVFMQAETTTAFGWQWFYADDATLVPLAATPTPTLAVTATATATITPTPTATSRPAAHWESY